MSVNVDVATVGLNTDGATKTFNLTGEDGALFFYAANHLQVWFVAADGTASELAYPADFTIAGNGRTGTGTLTTTAADALAAGGVLVVNRITERTQPEVWGENDGFSGATMTNAQDRGRMIDQDNARDLAKTLRAQPYDGLLDALPSLAQRQNGGDGSILVFDGETGQPRIADKTAAQLETYLADSETVHDDRVAADASASAAAAAAAVATATGNSRMFEKAVSSGDGSSLEEANLPAVIETVQVAGHYTKGDGGATIRVRGANMAGAVQSADGAYWQVPGGVTWNAATFGAKSDWNGAGGTDDSAAIQNAVDLASAADFPNPVEIRAAAVALTGITNPAGVPIRNQGRIYVPSSEAVGYTIGALGAAAIEPETKTKHVIAVGSDRNWALNNVAIRIANVVNLYADISASQAAIGVDFNADTSASAYIAANLRHISDCRTGIRFWAHGDAGYSNHNNIFGEGRIGSGIDDAELTAGVEFRCSNANGINDINFFGTSFEIVNATGKGTCFKGTVDGTATQAAANVRLFGGRCEATDYVLSGAGVQNSDFDFSYAPLLDPTQAKAILNPDADDDFLALANNRFSSPLSFPFHTAAHRQIARFHRLHVVRRSETYVSRPARGVWVNGATGKFLNESSNATVSVDGVQLTGNDAIGFLFDLSNIQQDYNFKIAIRAYLNADGGTFAAKAWHGNVELTDPKYIGFDGAPAWRAPSGFFQLGADLTKVNSMMRVTIGREKASGTIPNRLFLGYAKAGSNADLAALDYFVPAESGIKLITSRAVANNIAAAGSDVITPLDQDRPISNGVPDDPYYPYGSKVDACPEIVASGAPYCWLLYPSGVYHSLGNAP